MASLDFYSIPGFTTHIPAASGLGFYGSGGFGYTVAVGSYQDNTYVTDANGTLIGPQANNIKYHNAGSGIVGTAGSGIALKAIPSYQATVNARFTHGTAVKTQTVNVRIYDRSSINNPASGVTVKVAEIAHPSPVQGATGSGDATWSTPGGSATVMTLISSPGTSGTRPNGINTTDTRHDSYLAISASPDSIGSKLFAMYMSLEYL